MAKNVGNLFLYKFGLKKIRINNKCAEYLEKSRYLMPVLTYCPDDVHYDDHRLKEAAVEGFHFVRKTF